MGKEGDALLLRLRLLVVVFAALVLLSAWLAYDSWGPAAGLVVLAGVVFFGLISFSASRRADRDMDKMLAELNDEEIQAFLSHAEPKARQEFERALSRVGRTLEVGGTGGADSASEPST